MRRIAFVVVVVASLAGCPGKDDLVNQVGGAPNRQVQDARAKLDKAAVRVEARTEEGAKNVE